MLSLSNPIKRGFARFVDSSYVDKKQRKRKRYYIHLSTPEFVESPEFPFKPEEPLFVHIENGKLIIEKL